MISSQAKIVRKILKATSSNKGYDASRINSHRKTFERNMSLFFPSFSKKVERSSIADIPVATINSPAAKYRTIIYLHGGGFVLGSFKSHRQHLVRLAKMCSAKVITIEYGLSPEHPYPHALAEIQKVWEELLVQGLDVSRTAIIGDSAGGNLALASALRFRDAKLPQPACLVLLSPPLDATFSGKSYNLKRNKDPLLNMQKISFFANSYRQQHPKTNPFVSPIYADLKELPSFLIQVGSEELLLSDSETVAKNANRDGVRVTLDIREGMWHGWHFFASYVPEAKAAMRSIAKYIKSHTAA